MNSVADDDSKAAVPTTTAPEIILDEEIILNEICTDSVSNKEVISNLNIVTAVDNGIDNAKF